MTAALDILKASVPYVAIAEKDPNKPENRLQFDPSRYGKQLPGHAQERFWKMWYNNRGADRYARLFRAFGDQLGNAPGPVTRLFLPVGSQFQDMGKYSVNEAHLLNVLYDYGTRYVMRPGGYYIGFVYDTKNNRDVSIMSVLHEIGDKEHKQAAQSATFKEILEKMEKMTFTTAGDRPGAKGAVNKRFSDVNADAGTAFDNKLKKVRQMREIANGMSWTKIDKLIDAINQDPVRQNSTLVGKSNVMVVISRDPIDIATLSTNRAWSSSSCLRLDYDRSGSGGGNGHYIANMVKYGAIVVYGVKCGDENINAPVARTTLLPFINTKDEDDIVLLPSQRPGQMYGEPFPGYYTTLYNFLDQVNAGNKGGMYRPAPYKFYTGDIGGDNVDYPVPVWSQDRDIEETLKKFGITKYTIRPDKRVDVDGDVILKLDSGDRYSRRADTETQQIPIKFGKVTGSFTVGAFDASKYDPDWYTAARGIWNKPNSFQGQSIPTTNLRSLKGFPEWVGGDFCIVGLTTESLEGCPPHVGGHFIAAGLSRIGNLVGGPVDVGGNYDVSASACKSTKGLDGARIGRSLVLNHTQVTHLDGKAASVGLDVEISCTPLRTTIGLPDRVDRDCYIRECKNLVTLRGMPLYIGRNLSMSFCHNIKDLGGLTETEIMGDMWFREGGLTEIKYYPKRVKGDMQLVMHHIPRGVQKPPTVEGLMLLGYKDDGSDHEQKGKGNSDSTNQASNDLSLDFDIGDFRNIDEPEDELAI